VTLNSLERVMWRIRAKHPNTSTINVTILKRAIMVECGTSPQTYYNNRDALKALGWIRLQKGHTIRLTNKDLTGDY